MQRFSIFFTGHFFHAFAIFSTRISQLNEFDSWKKNSKERKSFSYVRLFLERCWMLLWCLLWWWMTNALQVDSIPVAKWCYWQTMLLLLQFWDSLFNQSLPGYWDSTTRVCLTVVNMILTLVLTVRKLLLAISPISHWSKSTILKPTFPSFRPDFAIEKSSSRRPAEKPFR